MRDVAVITGSRAEYGLLKPVMALMRDSSIVRLRTVVTGSHLEGRFGDTWREIVDDGFTIDARVPVLGDGDDLIDMARSISRSVEGVAAHLAACSTDAVVVLGDRSEIFGAVAAAYTMRVPVAHIAGGEVTMGALDDGYRHAMTKLSHWHFVATEDYGRRVAQMGEAEDRIHVVGALGVDAARSTPLLDHAALEESLGFALGNSYVLVTFHPETLEPDLGITQLEELLAALDGLVDLRVLFTMPNADSGTDTISARIRRFVRDHPDRAMAAASLGQQRYLSAMKHAVAVVGNSSSGIIEAPSMGTATVNIGGRQAGRVRADSVIDCAGERHAIRTAIESALSTPFRERVARAGSPYGDGHAAERIVAVLERDLAQPIDVHKRFRDAEMRDA